MMDPELSRRLDRIEHRLKVIGDLASACFGSAFILWLPDKWASEGVRWVLGTLAFIATPIYYRWQFDREPE